MSVSTFGQQMAMSKGAIPGVTVGTILTNEIPGAEKVWQAEEADDRNGTDWWVQVSGGSRVSVDAKIRANDWALRGADDLALETISVMKTPHPCPAASNTKSCCMDVPTQRIGWTLDLEKHTDYILWFWGETGRWCLVPFRLLCGVFREQMAKWQRKYRSAIQTTPNWDGETHYHSECLFVDRKIVWAEIYKKYAGSPLDKSPS